MKIDDIEKFSRDLKGKLFLNYSIKNTNWFNIGGKAKIFFKPETLEELTKFLSLYNARGKIFILGAGSNILFQDKVFDGVIIKLGRNFANITIINDEMIVAGSATTDKKISEFAQENSIGGFEFLSCIPGSVGGGLKMNSGCFNREFKDIVVSVQAIDKLGKIITLPSNKIKFGYRETNLSKDLIFLSVSFKGKKKDKNLIKEEIISLKKKKEISQPSKIKTGGSTFKNPIDQTNKKVWQLIKESVPQDLKFGDAMISEKHSNFFVNKNNASYKDMEKLINFVKDSVLSKTGIKLKLEIILVK